IAQVSSLESEVARLRAEAQGQPFSDTPGNPDMALQAAIYAHRKAEFSSNVENFGRKLGELKALAERSHLDAVAYRERLALAKDVEQMRGQLQSMQVGSRLNTLSAVDNRTEMSRALANAEQT